MQKHMIISVLWDGEKESVLSFICIPHNFPLQEEDGIKKMIEENKNFTTIEHIVNNHLSAEQLEEYTPILKTFQSKVTNYDIIDVYFITCLENRSREYVLSKWMTAIEKLEKFRKFFAIKVKVRFPN